MDAAVTETIEHLQDRLGNPAEFFEAVQKDFQEHREDYDGFRSAFESRGFGTAYEQLGQAGAVAEAPAAERLADYRALAGDMSDA